MTLTIPRSHLAIMAHVPQWPGEPDGAYSTMIQWIRHHACETSTLSRMTGVPAGQIAGWRRRWEWDARLDESPYMADGSLVLDRLRADATVDMVERLTEGRDTSQIATALARRQIQMLLAQEISGSALPPSASDVVAMASAAKTLAEVERLCRGQSTQNVDVRQSIRIDPDALAEMTSEEIELLERALPQVLPAPQGDDNGR